MDGDNSSTRALHRSTDGGARPTDHSRAIFEAKLRPPHVRDGIIPRTALVDRMLARAGEPLVAVVAPPGYGKTTLLAEWASKQGRDVAWVSVDESDNDPSVLLAATAVAVSRVRPIDPDVVDALRARTNAIPHALDTFLAAVPAAGSMTLVLDNVESVASTESLDLLAGLVWGLPQGARLAYASRSPLPLPTPLLHARGAVVEIGSADLAMDRAEAQLLLAAAGATLSAEEVDDLFVRTEGWPAGLYLAGLASKGHRPLTDSFAFHGNDVLMGDYLRTEILADLDPATVAFLTRTSVLDQLSGPLCDAVLATEGTQAVLESLESSNLLLVPLDRQRTWYRYHRLFRDLLATELARREPALVPTLHGRAASWLEVHGLPEPAIRQAQRAEDPDLVARLVATTIQPAYAAGRAAEIRSWLEWFRTNDLIDRYPQTAALGAVIEALSGDPASAERWAAAAEASSVREDPSAGPFAASLAFMRAVLTRDGPDALRADARTARDLFGPTHPLYAAAIFFEAASHLFDGDHDAADPILAHGYDVAVYHHAMPVAVASSAFRAMIAIRREDWDDARVHAARAVAAVETGHLEDYLEAGIVYAVAARVAAHDSDLPAATDAIARAARVRPLQTYGVPVTALIQLEMVRAYLQVADAVGARTVLRELVDTLRQRPHLGVVAAEVEELRGTLDAIRQGPVGASSLTAAELRLLPYLATHMSFREIGERLFVSRHTVKSQAISLYRKLGASSRSEALARAAEIGLLGR